MAISKLNPSAGGIPFGDTAGRPTAAIGKLYSNGQTARLELYTSAGAWENIVQEVPGVSSISGAYNESTGSATITIIGTNFVNGAIASVIGTNGVETQATTTTYNSLVQLTAVFTGLNATYEPFDVKVTNPSNLFGISVDALYINQSPVWQYSSGSLGTFSEGSAITPLTALATDPENSSLTFSITSGALPSGLSLNTSTGVISGTPTGISSNTTYSFTVSVTDGSNTLSRNFSILINSVVTWSTTSGNIGTVYPDITSVFSYTLLANALANTPSYSVTSGSLPTGLSLDSSTGVISGTADSVGSNTTYTFTVRASDGTATADRSFNIIVNAPIVSGGTLYSDTTHLYRTFTSGTSNLVLTQSIPVDYVLVAGGGGGGGGNAAGGGAGGLIELTNQTLSAQTYSIVIGNGGAGGSSSSLGSDGQNSTAFGKTALGGGGGAWDDKSGRAGGSGGGGADDPSAVGGAGNQPGSASGGYGNRGGNVTEPFSSGGGAGGGGAGGAGADVVNNNIDPNQHYGGIGRTSSLINAIGSATSLGHLSSSNYYFAGGGSGSYKGNAQVVPAVAGGGGASASNGISNTGGGGGGATSGTGGAGGSGVLVIRYAKSAVGG
jgi:hypothetical protein